MSASEEDNTSVYKEANNLLKSFVAHNPAAEYAFDGERDTQVSEICRKGASPKDCITLQMNSRDLFKAMQDLGFFCSVPIDPERTHINCKPMPK
ncbi:hypothetical protein E4T56_gene10627 [Termitomyces sp. T112]|nr:hypothetical protein E4T56_gene10627 [Termitomyces sp. T112]KAH0584055.1 hypothetical protein H2248_009629 [Termitomyces sp. 'cryptogamus']